MKLELPWFDKILNPNARPHWTKKAKAKSAQFEVGRFEASRTHKPTLALNYALKILFYPPDKRNRDLDNCLSSIKSGLDGIACGWQVNDKLFKPITIDFGEVVKGGKIIIEVKS